MKSLTFAGIAFSAACCGAPAVVSTVASHHGSRIDPARASSHPVVREFAGIRLPSFRLASRHGLDGFCEQKPFALRQEPRSFEPLREENVNGAVGCGVIARGRPAPRRRGHSLSFLAVDNEAAATRA